MLEGFFVGLWTSLIIALTVYSYYQQEDVALLFCSILLIFSFFFAGIFVGEKMDSEKLKKGEVKVEVD
ncbi:hypothetical protein AB1L07_01355 [Niallia alba]|uniref:hypothetical protein n=1 Tax=Niallia alba TaxID=2729105 RepID=UPI0039A123ED